MIVNPQGKRDLRAFVRIDGTGRVVPGSLILRRNKPKVGNWREIPAYICCAPSTLSPGLFEAPATEAAPTTTAPTTTAVP